MTDTYEVYCQWCRDHNHTPTTREWWDAAIRQPRKTIVFEPDFDFETERREGWICQ